jgi:hypothetical protein
MCEPKKSQPLEDALAAVGAGAAAVGRGALRLCCRRLSDQQLTHGRKVLGWAWSPILLAIALYVQVSGRWAVPGLVGAAAASWLLSRALAGEVWRRQEVVAVHRIVHPEPEPVREPVRVEDTPVLDDELQRLAAEVGGRS